MKSNFNWALIGVGGMCINIGLKFGIGFDLGWWGVLVWIGIGVILASVINEVRA